MQTHGPCGLGFIVYESQQSVINSQGLEKVVAKQLRKFKTHQTDLLNFALGTAIPKRVFVS